MLWSAITAQGTAPFLKLRWQSPPATARSPEAVTFTLPHSLPRISVSPTCLWQLDVSGQRPTLAEGCLRLSPDHGH